MADSGLDDLVEAVDAMARIIGGPVVIEDLDYRVLAYSAIPGQTNDEARREAILNRRMPDLWVSRFSTDGVRRRLLGTDDVISLDMLGPGFRPRLITGISLGASVVGFLWAMEGTTPFPPDVADTMRQFAIAIGPELARRSGGLLENPQGHLLRQFLAGAIPAKQVAEALRTTVDTDVVVVAFGIRADSADGVVLRSRALKVLALHVKSGHHEPCLIGTVDQRIYLLQAVSPATAPAAVEMRLSGIVRHLKAALGVRVFAAAGTVAPLADGVSRSRAQAELALTVLASRTDGPAVGRYEHLRLPAVLHAVGEFLGSQPLLTEGIVGELADHDRRHGTKYLLSVTAYLESFGDMRGAAKALHVHPNTLRYRLKRLADLTGIDLADPGQRLALQLLLLARSAGAVSGRPVS